MLGGGGYRRFAYGKPALEPQGGLFFVCDPARAPLTELSSCPHAVETRALVKRYGDTAALNGLDLAICEGEIYGFLGPNGAGKTTTIRILTGLSRPSGGHASVSGADVVDDPVRAKRQIGVVSQHVNLDADLTVAENLELHAILHGMAKGARRARAAELLEFAGLSDRAAKPARTLSGGMKRRLTIIRALLHDPRILFLDEPTAGLDPVSRRKLWDLIRSVHRKGVTVFLTTHYIEEAEFLCSRVGILDRGKLIAEGEPRAMLAELGEHAVDLTGRDATRTQLFQSRDEALEHLRTSGGEGVVRRANLEDLFLQLTGRRVEP